MPQTCPIHSPFSHGNLANRPFFSPFAIWLKKCDSIAQGGGKLQRGDNLPYMNESHAKKKMVGLDRFKSFITLNPKTLNLNLKTQKSPKTQNSKTLKEVILNLKEPTIVEGMTTSCKGERSQEGAKPRKRGIDPS